MDQATLRVVQALLANTDETIRAVARRLGMGTVTLYAYLIGEGSLKEVGLELMAGEQTVLAVASRSIDAKGR